MPGRKAGGAARWGRGGLWGAAAPCIVIGALLLCGSGRAEASSVAMVISRRGAARGGSMGGCLSLRGGGEAAAGITGAGQNAKVAETLAQIAALEARRDKLLLMSKELITEVEEKSRFISQLYVELSSIVVPAAGHEAKGPVKEPVKEAVKEAVASKLVPDIPAEKPAPAKAPEAAPKKAEEAPATPPAAPPAAEAPPGPKKAAGFFKVVRSRSEEALK